MNLFEKHTQLTQLFAQNPVTVAYLAGSLSNRAPFGDFSDVDIAILLMEQIKADQFLEYQLYFFSELAKRLESDNIDVLILNKASLLLKSHVIKYGQLLYSRDEKKRIMFETRAVMDYLDYRKYNDIQNQALGRRLKGQLLSLNREIARQQLKNLREATIILRELGEKERDEFATNYRLYGAGERYLLQAIEACLQLCAMLIAALSLRKPEEQHDLLGIIATEQIIPRPLAYKLEHITNQRDSLLYEPHTIDRRALHASLQRTAHDLETFADTIEPKLEA
ncbi:uncharacterized protein YutE (UPF0331/DUF86 family) [Thermosporothrix hazakensis]|jgi:uncharacterized protein YutE (UPF0331/DUF86 family)/predicted nucleotidyltransferase|uniref:Uncharacterized protein YutE (UPF0331/DUF86 family) n=2 Tax=Thermosporothrix TaxID=768650 RepID=A0A326UE28_THEHA|nr:HepT-like ribonuclease domain-containing protein [Thermosporothrix hazakensis]PZW36294.1 uncharacterized protein YutE (UPF0331/DUF86 family) [Thermosporothrix hazakensis]BBH88760.1 hypothetical protein KTC_35110 [Thermosporothrix sp. COM3]GCE46944.1 hypothetical protein KTH_18130 [Thermosporothrix hazakensis]